MADPAKLRILDTTLRDGEQSPGATMTTEEKIQVAQQLLRLNVDIIEAGFPATSPGDLLAVREIAHATRGHDVAIAGLAPATKRCRNRQPSVDLALPGSIGPRPDRISLAQFDKQFSRRRDRVARSRRS